MPAPYPVLNTNDTISAYSMFQFVNTAANNFFFPAILLVIWVVSFIGAISEGRQASRAFVFASFIYAALSILLAFINLLNPNYMYFSFLMVAGGMIWYQLENAPGI